MAGWRRSVERAETQSVTRMIADELKAGDVSSAGVGLVSLALPGMSALHARSLQNQTPDGTRRIWRSSRTPSYVLFFLSHF